MSTSAAASPKRPLALSTSCDAPCKAHPGAKVLLSHGITWRGQGRAHQIKKAYNIILLSYSINYNVYIYNMIQYPFWIWQCWYQVPDLTAEYFPIRHICSGLWTLCSAVSFQQQESHRCEVIAAQSWSSDIQGQAIAAERSCLPSWPALPKEVILHLYMCHEHLCVTISVR